MLSYITQISSANISDSNHLFAILFVVRQTKVEATIPNFTLQIANDGVLNPTGFGVLSIVLSTKPRKPTAGGTGDQLVASARPASALVQTDPGRPERSEAPGSPAILIEAFVFVY